MKILKAVATAAILLGALVAFGWFFVSQMGPAGSARNDEPAAVLFSPPPGYAVVDLRGRGELSGAAAAAELEDRALRPGAGPVALHFRRPGAEVYWLADPAGDVLEERAAGTSGTRLQAVWHGGLRQRLRWGREHGDFDAPGLPPGERANLYH